jgi:hypothetical protein
MFLYIRFKHNKEGTLVKHIMRRKENTDLLNEGKPDWCPKVKHRTRIGSAYTELGISSQNSTTNTEYIIASSIIHAVNLPALLTQLYSEWVVIRSHELARSARACWRNRFSVVVVRCVRSGITKKAGHRHRLASKERRAVSQTEQENSVKYTHLLKCFFLAALIFCVTGVTKLSVGEI